MAPCFPKFGVIYGTLQRKNWCHEWRPTWMNDNRHFIIEQDEKWFIAFAPDVPGANGQGRTQDEAMQSLKGAIELILKDQRDGIKQ